MARLSFSLAIGSVIYTGLLITNQVNDKDIIPILVISFISCLIGIKK